jgi:hypothetical protein
MTTVSLIKISKEQLYINKMGYPGLAQGMNAIAAIITGEHNLLIIT